MRKKNQLVKTSSTVSRVLSWMIICLDCTLPHSSSARITPAERNLPASTTGRRIALCWSCFEWGLHSLLRYRSSGGLLHRHSTLTCTCRRFIFCCTGLGVASTGRYPAPCPVKPGLSSPNGRDHLCCSLCYSIKSIRKIQAKTGTPSRNLLVKF